MRRRSVRLAIVALLGLLVGVAASLTYLRLTAPAPRPAPGWELLAEMPGPRGETAVAVADGLVYVAGGFTGIDFATTGAVSIYEAASDRWHDGPPLPEPRNHAAAAAHAGVVYVSGGTAPDGAASDLAWSLAAGGQWERIDPMPGPRSGHRMVALGDRLYVIGGVGGPAAGAGATGRVLIFDGTWTEGAAMPVNRDHLAVVVVGEEIWAIGGRAAGVNHRRVDIYDPAADAWHSGPPLPEATSGAAEAVLDGVIYISGGEDPATGSIVDRHWRLDTSLGDAASWEPLAPPPLAVHGVQGAAIDGRFLVIAGSTRAGGQSNTGWTGATQAFRPR